jgi:FMN reductase
MNAEPAQRAPRIVGFCGTTWRPARACALVEAVGGELRRAHGLEPVIHDLADVVPDLCSTRPEAMGPRARALLAELQAADGIIIGCPVFQGSFPGLFKHVFDMVAPGALRDRPVLLTAVGGGMRHSLMVEHQLRPLFGFFEARTVPTAVYACAAELEPGRPLPAPLTARIGIAAEQFARQFDHRRASAA